MYKTIVVGTDGSDTATEAVRHAVELARLHQAALHVISAYPANMRPKLASDLKNLPTDLQWVGHATEMAEAVVSDAVHRAGGDGMKVKTSVHEGDPADVLIDHAEAVGADLIVVGNKGMTGARRFILGSVPNKVAHHSPCSVLIVHTTP